MIGGKFLKERQMRDKITESLFLKFIFSFYK